MLVYAVHRSRRGPEAFGQLGGENAAYKKCSGDWTLGSILILKMGSIMSYQGSTALHWSGQQLWLHLVCLYKRTFHRLLLS